jgi:aspartyl-tRNA(Asn)/glutamyl-tRNA(Gln) amidotransferase subunit A
LIGAAWVDEGQPYLIPLARQGPGAFADRGNWSRVVLNELVRRSHVVKAGRVRTVIQREFQAAMAQVDLLAMPTTPTVAFPIDRAAAPPTPANPMPATFTMWLNLVGAPAISVPCGLSDGMPVGLMLAGRHWEDDFVVRAAYAYEQATGGFERPPIS